MVARSYAAPPTPWSKSVIEPKIHETAYIHSFSNIIGDVRIGPNVMVSPGTSIRADEGHPFYIGEGTNVQDGVVIHGLEEGRVVGDDNNSYSVWIGNNVSITHLTLIHGPAYVGNHCFIGFRSTVFNARVGEGCIVMMHALIQDVEIPPGKYVPSGSIITHQQQADRLPDVQASDIKFATHVLGINDALRSGYHSAENVASAHNFYGRGKTDTVSSTNGFSTQSNTSTSLSKEAVEQVRSLLSKGYKIGTEHADKRRFQTSSWQSCSPIDTKQESEAFAALEECLANHDGEYVRLIGIDTKTKRRALETIIQRPDGKVSEKPSNSSPQQPDGKVTQKPSNSIPPADSSRKSSPSRSTGLNSEVVQQVQQLLAQGCLISTEYADERRFKTNSWQSEGVIQASQESEALADLEAILEKHTSLYVRLIGIDPKAKRRVVEMMLQRPSK